jgi:Trk K+ transport system NAD-binding subunit
MIFEIPGLDRPSIDIRDTHAREIRIINIPIMSGGRAAGKPLKEVRLFELYGVCPLFILRPGHFITRPTGDEILDDSTTLFLIGRADALAEAVEKEFIAFRRGGISAVIAGYGDVGAAAYRELVSAGVNCTVVDRQGGVANAVVGEAQDEAVLTRAGIGEAQFCIVALNDDDINIFTTLMARNLNPAIRILARANEPGSVDKLYRAGADYVALLPTIGGQTLARIILSDVATVILDLPNGDTVLMKRMKKPRHATVGGIERATGVRVIGLEGGDRQIVRPGPDEPIREGDALIVVGSTGTLKRFIHL